MLKIRIKFLRTFQDLLASNLSQRLKIIRKSKEVNQDSTNKCHLISKEKSHGEDFSPINIISNNNECQLERFFFSNCIDHRISYRATMRILYEDPGVILNKN